MRTKRTLAEIESGAQLMRDYCRSALAKNKELDLKLTLESQIEPHRHFVPESEIRPVLEQKIQAEILRYLKAKGFWAFKTSAQNLVGKGGNYVFAKMTKGIPDIIATKSGAFCAIEAKAATGKSEVSADQIIQINAIRLSGSHAFVAHSIMCVERYFEASDNLKLPPAVISEYL